MAERGAAFVKKPLYQIKDPQQNAGKLMSILEKNAMSPESTRQKAQRYLREKQAREERKVLIDGVYRDPEDPDGKKEREAARREERKKVILMAVGVLILAGAAVMCVLTAKGINPMDNLNIQPLSKFRFRF